MRRTASRRHQVCVGMASILAVFAVAGTAHAALPGANGRIAFQSNQGGDFEVWTVDSAGGTPQQLTTNAVTDGDPAWSPDGSTIAFATNRDGNYEIYTMNADRVEPATRSPRTPATDGRPAGRRPAPDRVRERSRRQLRDLHDERERHGPDASHDQRRRRRVSSLVPGRHEDRLPVDDLEHRDLHDEHERRAQVNLTNHAANDTAPNWAPDGTQIAFVSTRTGNGDIYTMNANGTNQALAKGDAASDNSPAYSPQGTLLAWARTPAPSYDLFSGNAAFLNTGSTLYASAGHDEAPDWQPLNNSTRGRWARRRCACRSCPPTSRARRPTPPTGAPTSPRVMGRSRSRTGSRSARPTTTARRPTRSGYVRISAFCNGGAPGEAPPCLTTPGDQLDGKIVLSMTDVRCQGVSTGCTGALADYTGLLWFFADFRLTDKNSGPTGVGPSANADHHALSLDFGVPCTATRSTAVGSTCSITTSIDAVLGSNTAIAEQKRGIWELGGSLRQEHQALRRRRERHLRPWATRCLRPRGCVRGPSARPPFGSYLSYTTSHLWWPYQTNTSGRRAALLRPLTS